MSKVLQTFSNRQLRVLTIKLILLRDSCMSLHKRKDKRNAISSEIGDTGEITGRMEL